MMTNEELMDHLSHYPKQARVVISATNGNYFLISEVEMLEVKGKKTLYVFVEPIKKDH